MADASTPAKETPVAVPAAKADEPLVFLYAEPHARFNLSGAGLEDLVPEGTAYSPKDADLVRTLCMKYGVRFNEAG